MRKFFNALSIRFKNYGFCVSFFALIPIICQMLDVELPFDEYNTLINAILTFLVAAGIVSNPTTESKWYRDDRAH